jgi:general L-amino acid transport system substrate-binding protein
MAHPFEPETRMTRAATSTLRLAIAGIAFSAAVAGSAEAGTLDVVKQRGQLLCGVSQGLFGFSERNAQGEWSGFDVDFCRAIAGAIFGDGRKVSFVPLSASERFDALKQGRIDVLSRNSTWTLDREAGFGLLFAGVNFYDGQGFMVRREKNVLSALELDKAKVCVQEGTTAVAGTDDFFKANSITAEIKTYPDAARTLAAFEAKECDAMTTDNSGLHAERLKLGKPADAVVLPDIISKEPLAPAVRADDVQWYNTVKWVNFALINAEELGVTAANAEEAAKSAKPDVKRFAGVEGGFGAKLGLANGWAVQSVKAAGNYAEIFERNVGSNSRLGIPRGLNQLWQNGGILYAPPVR